MLYCTACGSELSNDQQFCTNCGHKQEQGDGDQLRPAAMAGKEPGKPLSKKKKVFFSVIAGLVLILFGAHQCVTASFDPLKKVRAMDRAISEKDSDSFFKQINLDDEAMLNKEEYFAYIMEQNWQSVRDQFTALTANKEQELFDLSIYNNQGETLFLVKRDEVAFGLYTKYTFEAVPTELIVSTNLPETEVVLNEKSHMLKEQGKPEKIMKLYPGSYSIAAKAEGQYGEFSYEEERRIEAGLGTEIAIEFPVSYYQVRSNVEGATLVVDGNKTGKTLEELEEVGPFPENQDVDMFAEWENPDGKMVKSETITQSGSSWGSLHFTFDEKVTRSKEEIEKEKAAERVASEQIESEEAEDYVLLFREAYEEALNEKDFSKIEPFLEPDSVADKELEKYVSDLEDKGYHYNFTSNEVYSVDHVNDEIIEVSTNERFIFTNHMEEQIDYDRDKVYTIRDSEDGYQILKIEYSDTDRTKR